MSVQTSLALLSPFDLQGIPLKNRVVMAPMTRARAGAARLFISNPDLVERFALGWPLNPEAEMKDWYSADAQGYVDFPFYQN